MAEGPVESRLKGSHALICFDANWGGEVVVPGRRVGSRWREGVSQRVYFGGAGDRSGRSLEGVADA